MNNKIILLIAGLVFTSVSLSGADVTLNDPTKPPKFAAPKVGTKQKTKLRLTEVKIASNGRQAVINGQRLKTGDSVAGYRLRKIEVGYVILANEKETLRLNLISSRLIRKKL